MCSLHPLRFMDSDSETISIPRNLDLGTLWREALVMQVNIWLCSTGSSRSSLDKDIGY